jgi:hypothetical protein
MGSSRRITRDKTSNKKETAMQHLEQMQKTHRKHTVEEQPSTFPENHAPLAHGGGDNSDIDDLLERIEQVLSDATLRALGRSTGIEAA